MGRKNFKPEQIIKILRGIESLLAEGKNLRDCCRTFQISDNTFYRWKKEYGGMQVDQAKRLKQLEKENLQLKKIVADQQLEIAVHKEISKGNF
mgnify:CR=1 FL=1